MSLGQDIFVNLLQHIWTFAKETLERHRLVRMKPGQLKEWRTEEFAKIHQKAVKLAGFTNDKELRNRGIGRADLVRRYEVLLLNDLGVQMSKYLLEGKDIRGLDLRDLRGLNQQQINHAVGDVTTRLPDYLEVPRAWLRGGKVSR